MSARRAALAAVLGSCLCGGAALAALVGSADAPAFADVRAQWTPSDAELLDRSGVPIDRERVDLRVRRAAWTPLTDVSPALVAAIVDGEDRHFWQHGGVDWTALLAAARDSGLTRSRRGASTIPMQLAALLEPRARAGRGSGALWRKLRQIRLARGLDGAWSKREILEAYLNLLGFRGELQGIGAAAQVLAGKAPSGLTLSESLVLAALLPAPRASAPRAAARACARAAARQVAVDCLSLQATAAQLLDPRARPAPPAAPRLAPQLARALLVRPGQRVRTTLDADIQRLARDTLTVHLAGLAGRNVRDGAVLVADNATGAVLAYVGSAGPQSRARAVDGVRARRQAGSTLKPFLYALALERRYLTAASLLDDSPISLDTASGIYLPQDYDRDFKGLVSVRTALASSLNVPAVRALVLVGVEPFRERLHALGYAGIVQGGDFYGYALALGSAEVSLWEQVQAYRALARGGRAAPLHTQPGAAGPERPLLAPDASFVVADILSDRAARALTFGLDSHLNTPFWSAVKTGTSKDMRDNWCIGFSRRYTVGVWVGNFEGDAMHDVSGVTGAAPVWQQLMLALHEREPSEAPPAPEGVETAVARFEPAVEPARRERFLGAGAPVVRVAGGLARIVSPTNGMVIALDPDVPPALQRVPLAAQGADAGMVLKLNGQPLGPARNTLLWQPERGRYLLELADAAGHTLQAARFSVR